MFLFVQSDIVNPIFSSQTKEKLITEPKQFGSTFEFTPQIIKKILTSEIVERILDWAQQKAIAEEKKELRQLNKTLGRSKILKLIDAKESTKRTECSLAIFEGDCLEENTSILALRENDARMFRTLKEVKIDDYVLTHDNNLKRVTAKSSKISKTALIKTKSGVIETSYSHKMWVYDTEEKTFDFVQTSSLVKGRHKIVKSKLANNPVFLKIEDITKSQNGVLITTEDGMIFASYTHRFLVFEIDNQKFLLKSSTEISPDHHMLVLTSE
jgi:DNA gyrase/topoisomerase IV subunit B